MTTYPSMDQYNDAVQHPQTAFSDPALKSGKVAANGLGIPVALGGGFALTYSVASSGRRYAVRCFHKATNGLEDRYAKISRTLGAAGSQYFVGFQYQPTGILVNGKRYPIVRMDWAEGDTLGNHLEAHFSDSGRLNRLRADLQSLQRFLWQKSIAHGDLQNGNLIVGRDLRLIDYDGVFVSDLPKGQGTEIGHKHFQHPKRTERDFGPDMDRFSFIVLDISLRALAERPSLFQKFSNGENVVFTASDYADPANSVAFSELRSLPSIAKDVERLAQVCTAEPSRVPMLEDFLAGRNIPAGVIVLGRPASATTAPSPTAYIGAFDVLDARDFTAMARRIGDRIELIGEIVEVRMASTRQGKPYVFLNFGNWRQNIAKITIWSEGIAKLRNAPSSSWKGKWVSVTGLVDAPYTNRRYGYTHLSITITDASQIRFIDAREAARRLGVRGAEPTAARAGGSRNRGLLDGLKPGGGTPPPVPRRGTPSSPPAPKTLNQALLDQLRPPGQASPPVGQSPRPGGASRPPPQRKGIPPWVWWIGGICLLLLWLWIKKR